MGGDEPWHAFKLEVKNPSPRLPLKTIFSSKSNPYIMQQHLQVLFHTWVIFLVGRLHCQPVEKGVRVVSRSGCHFEGKVTKEKIKLLQQSLEILPFEVIVRFTETEWR
ncbi:hypothetical protein CDAR_474401 [Caerostris darwini]|uniref:Uncharacterized protein n=1 Tax=Caerostris darwini TaxID=1538125 RepID=A0AAV4M4A0_9ARAC|nr:hypothetical protein CDAR_474401 [Caerostris darwini]